MSYNGIIFDLDGTLLDTLADIAGSVNRVLQDQGLPAHDLEAYRFFVGDGSRMLVKRALPEKKRSDESVESTLNAFKQEYEKTWDDKTEPYEGVADLLDALVKRGVHLAVCSNKPQAFTKLCVGNMLNRWTFDHVVGLSSLYPKKPAPDSALAIAGHMRIAPEQVLFLGDSGVDMQTAVAAGMFPAGASWGFRPDKELLDNGCRFLARHPLDLLKFFG